MASAPYPKGYKSLLDADIDMLVDNLKLILYDANDGAYDAADQFVADLPGAGIVARSGNLASKTTTGGVFDAANLTVSAVTGDTFEAVILFQDTGSDATAKLIAYLELAAPYSPDGGDISVVFNASGIISIVAVC